MGNGELAHGGAKRAVTTGDKETEEAERIGQGDLGRGGDYATEGGEMDAAEGIVEGQRVGEGEEGGDSGDEEFGRRGGRGRIVGKGGRGEAGDVAEEEAINVAGRGDGSLDDGGEGGPRDGDLLEGKIAFHGWL